MKGCNNSGGGKKELEKNQSRRAHPTIEGPAEENDRKKVGLL